MSSASFDTGLTPDDLDAERPRPILTPWGTMALYLDAGRVHALQAFCPHMEGPLFEGTLSNGTITCPWHQWCYDLSTCERLDRNRPPEGPGSEPLVRSEVTLGPGGTLVLARPARALRPDPDPGRVRE